MRPGCLCQGLGGSTGPAEGQPLGRTGWPVAGLALGTGWQETVSATTASEGSSQPETWSPQPSPEIRVWGRKAPGGNPTFLIMNDVWCALHGKAGPQAGSPGSSVTLGKAKHSPLCLETL